MIKRKVRFYEPRAVDARGTHRGLPFNFCLELTKHVETLTFADRTMQRYGVGYYGEAGIGTSPAVRYLYLGRLRSPADAPDRVKQGRGVVGPLVPNVGESLAEPSYILPFASDNTIAVTSLGGGGARAGAIEAWLTHVCPAGLQPGESIALVPVLDQALQQKLDNAVGSGKVLVTAKHDAPLDLDANVPLEVALAHAKGVGNDDMDVELQLSLGHRRGTKTMREHALQVARQAAAVTGLKKAVVSLDVPDPDEPDEVVTEVHDLLRDVVVEQVGFDIEPNKAPDVDTVLAGMQKAVERFRRRTGSSA